MNTNENMNNKIDDNSLAVNGAAEQDIALMATNLLNDHAQHLNASTLKRLSDARHLAVNSLAARQAAVQGVNQSGNVLQWLGHGFEQHRMMSTAMIAGAMLLTLFTVQQFNVDGNLESGDAFLLASELPPEAFADKGFDTWLVSKRD